MMKFSLSKGEGERTFLATGAHYVSGTDYGDYQITGAWGPPSEDGKIPVDFKITYIIKDWSGVDLKGVFDPEENSLRPIATSGEFPGEFVFKRDSDFVRFHPAPSIINARKRWEFSKTLVLDRVRRQAWSSKQILKKLKDGKRFIKLTLMRNSRTSMTRDEMQEHDALTFGLREEDVRFYNSIINVHLSKTIQFPYVAVPEPPGPAILTIMNVFFFKPHSL
jgi:hypothetical protein